MGFKIAIDGPCGAGKSTAAKALASKMGFIYVDTGAMYRAAALYFAENGLAIEECEEIPSILENIDIGIKYTEEGQRVFLNGEDVTGRIRSRQASENASKVSVIKEVREKLVAMQRKLAENSHVIMDGRDIGTYVLPDSQVKFFLTASVEERAHRRQKEFREKGVSISLGEITADIIDRDYRDTNREHNPLKKAEDAIVVDCGEMTPAEVVEHLYNIALSKGIKSAKR